MLEGVVFRIKVNRLIYFKVYTKYRKLNGFEALKWLIRMSQDRATLENVHSNF